MLKMTLNVFWWDADNIKTETEINRKHKNSICYLHLLFEDFPKPGHTESKTVLGF